MAKEIEKNILEWLSKHGYPLELKVERIISNCGFRTFNSTHFKDPDTNKFRELDLYAEYGAYYKDQLAMSVNTLIECKSSTKPFILLKKKQSKANLNSVLRSNYTFTHPMNGVLEACRVSNVQFRTLKNGSVGFRLIQAHVNSDKTVNDAGHKLRKSFNDFNYNIIERLDPLVRYNDNSIALPILVIDSPLFELELNEKEEMVLNPIDWGVWEFSVGHTSRISTGTCSIIVTNVDSLKDITLSIKEYCQRTLNALKENSRFQIVNFDIETFKKNVHRLWT